MIPKIDLRKYGDLHGELKINYSSLPIYGPFERQLLSNWGQSKIDRDTVMALNIMNINRMAPVQQHSFFYLMNHYNTAIIGFSKGKSTAYLASIFSLILNNSNDNQTNNIGIRPKAIILSSSLGSCSDLEYLSKIFNNATHKTKQIKVVVAYSFISESKIIGTLLNGCDILITTPTTLVNIINKTKSLFHWKNLKHVVFDNIDLMLTSYEDQMPCLLSYLLKFKNKSNDIQFISSSVSWSKDIDNFLNQLFVKWQYIFGSHLEATRYMQIGFSLVQVQNDKLEKILEFLKNNIKYRKCVLLTSNTSELDIIYDYIKQNSSDIEVLLPGPLKCSFVYTVQKWYLPLEKNQLIFICSDEMMFDFYIDNADCLIHYDIPVEKSSFSIRFSVLQDPNNIFTEKERSSYIFLSDNSKDMIQLPKIVDIMQTFGRVEPILLKYTKIIKERLEELKKNSIFCYNIEKFGICPNSTTCKYRHVLLKENYKPNDNIPRSGLVVVKILNIYDASHMSAKLLSVNSTLNINDEQNWSKVKDKSNLIEFKLKSFYADYNSRIIHKEPSIGDIVAVLSETKTGNIMNSVYLRGIILNLNDTQTMDPKVTVKLIDQGRVEIVSKSKLFVLPDMLKSIETDTVDIILASVKPIDNDKSWCNYANFAVKKQFKYFEECGDTVIVKVKMTLESTIWAKSIYRKYWDTKLKSYTIVEILPALLLNTGYANLNFDHIETIKELSISAGINTPAPISLLQNHDQEKTKNYKFGLKEYMSFYKLPQPQWAYFDEDCTCVSVEHICDPKTFFVRNIKYLDLFCEIQKKIENYVEQKLVQTLQLTHIVEEAICLAKYRSTDKYYRVKIIGTSNTLVDVIYVDLGEMYEIQPNSLLTIHPDLVVQLPFQAIECSLSGFKNEKLTENILNELINFFFDLTDNYMSLKVVNNVGLAELTGGNHYEVVLYNKDFVVNLELQSKFSQHCDDIQMSKLSDIVNYTPDTLNAGTILNPDNILDEDLTGESCSVHMQLFEELGLLKWFNLKWEENTLLAIDENIQENDLKEEKEKEEEEEESIKTKIETKNENANSYKFVETVEKIKPVDLALPEKPSNSKITKLKPRKTNKVICLTCNTNLQSITPICIWYQVENNIYLKFNILKIDNFRINYTDNCLLFNAKFDDLTYNFTAKLFGLIIENSITHKITYEGFHIKAEKQYQMKYKWPRLFNCNKWHKYLMYDPEHLEIKYNRTLQIRTINKYKMLATGSSMILDSKSSDSDTDDDDFIGVVCED